MELTRTSQTAERSNRLPVEAFERSHLGRSGRGGGFEAGCSFPSELASHHLADTLSQQVKIAIYASFIANCVLACLQLYAALSSLSLSFFATAIDSVFDPAANIILNYCHRKAANVDLRKFPSVRGVGWARRCGARELTLGVHDS